MKKINKAAITIVELIVVITILAILWTISILAFQGYTVNARDSVRVYDLNSIKTAIEYARIEQWQYITPDNGIDITYSWSVIVRNQGVFWNAAKRKTKRLDKVPLDPLTQDEYTFSVTANGWEFELWAIMEWDDLVYWWPSILNTTYAATSYRAYINGTYNGKIAKASSGGLDYIFALPSIISTDLWTPTISYITTNNLLVKKWYENLPSSYNNTDNGSSTLLERDFINEDEVVVFEWSFDDLKDEESEQILFLSNLQEAYSGTVISNISEIKEILDVDTTNNIEWTQFLAQILIKNTVDRNFDITAINSQNPFFVAITCDGRSPWATFIEEGVTYTVVENWTGTNGIKNISNLALIDPDWTWTNLCTSLVTDMSALFYNNSSFNEDISTWDTSWVTHMWSMFRWATWFNKPLNSWNVSEVRYFTGMFWWANSFNQPLDSWDTQSLTQSRNMFMDATSFNQSIDSWNMSGVQYTDLMFRWATSFNQPLNSWTLSSVTNMSQMFSGASSFNQPLNLWDTSSVTTMTEMFMNASSFNQAINSWDTSNVRTVWYMFSWASEFNQSLNSWDTSKFISMYEMFSGATNFNWNISSWDTSIVSDMYSTFYGASSFNQPLNSWNTSNVTQMVSTFRNASSFNQSLNSWSVGAVWSCTLFSNWSPLLETNKPSFTCSQ